MNTALLTNMVLVTTICLTAHYLTASYGLGQPPSYQVTAGLPRYHQRTDLPGRNTKAGLPSYEEATKALPSYTDTKIIALQHILTSKLNPKAQPFIPTRLNTKATPLQPRTIPQAPPYKLRANAPNYTPTNK